MKESILHFVWLFQKFHKSNLQSFDYENIEIFSAGTHNMDSGPDFLNAHIRIGKISWHGHVEIHVNSSDWNYHGHQDDPSYDNVILHVVWKNDTPIKTKDGKAIPTIELNDKVSNDLLMKCNGLINSFDSIPCSNQIGKADKMDVFSMQQKTAIERLKGKASLVNILLKKNAMNWEETAYQLLAKNFGFKINSDPFLSLAQRLPLNILKKHSQNPMQLEALLFGVSGMLQESPKDDYHATLMNEYVFLTKKYKLEDVELHKHIWKYMRLRPGNFPTIRISQLAAFLSKHPHVFDLFVNLNDSTVLKKKLRIEPSIYWQSHYDFGKPSARPLAGMGISSIENLLINTTIPLLAAYSQHINEPKFLDKALSILETLKPEKNKITRKWNELAIPIDSAFDSQALIELHNNYCLKKKCLSCKIGVGLINRS